MSSIRNRGRGVSPRHSIRTGLGPTHPVVLSLRQCAAVPRNPVRTLLAHRFRAMKTAIGLKQHDIGDHVSRKIPA